MVNGRMMIRRHTSMVQIKYMEAHLPLTSGHMKQAYCESCKAYLKEEAKISSNSINLLFLRLSR